jgi:hypothetical protein
MWKHQIVMGGKKKSGGEEYDMKKFNLEEKSQVEKDNPKLYPNGWKDMSGTARDMQKHFKK